MTDKLEPLSAAQEHVSDEDEAEIFSAEYKGDLHIFDDRGARQLWMEEVIKDEGVQPKEFQLWED